MEKILEPEKSIDLPMIKQLVGYRADLLPPNLETFGQNSAHYFFNFVLLIFPGESKWTYNPITW